MVPQSLWSPADTSCHQKSWFMPDPSPFVSYLLVTLVRGESLSPCSAEGLSSSAASLPLVSLPPLPKVFLSSPLGKVPFLFGPMPGLRHWPPPPLPFYQHSSSVVSRGLLILQLVVRIPIRISFLLIGSEVCFPKDKSFVKPWGGVWRLSGIPGRCSGTFCPLFSGLSEFYSIGLPLFPSLLSG